VLTGSSDGFIRAVQILPTKFIGVVADHGEFPVERIAVGSGASLLGQSKDSSESNPREAHASPSDHEEDDREAKEEEQRMQPGRWWLGSVGHDETLRMTDLGAFFHEISDESEEEEGEDEVDEWHGIQEQGNAADSTVAEDESGGRRNSAALPCSEVPVRVDSEEEEEPEAVQVSNQRKRKQENDGAEGKKSKKGKKEKVIDKAFFDEL
jgi:WD repeat-containing protein 55